MSVRRLAEDSVQPAGFAFNGDNAGWAERTIAKYPEGRQQSAVIPLLMRAQEQDGWVTKAAIEHIADRLAMPLIRVLEVATFYTQFQLKPVGTRAHVQVCGTTPCMLRGSDELKRVCQSKIHHDQFHLNASGTLSWEEVECLGACVNAPMVMIFNDTYEDLTAERLSEIIDAFDRGEGESVKVGPQIDRHLSSPFGGPTSLTTADEAVAHDGIEHDGSSASSAEAAEGQTPSQAGRPSTHAAETDPSIKSPGAAVGAAVDQTVENAESAGATSAAAPSGSGSTGGSEQGPTGAGQKEDGLEDHSSASADADAARHDGPLGEKGQRDEKAVVADERFVEAPEGSARALSGDRAPAAGSFAAPREEPPVEQLRKTEDTAPGPVADDHFETEAASASAATSFVTPEKPTGLLSAPDGAADDLKLIRGVGPVLEVKLHELGVYHFRQIAGWSAAELQWIDDHLYIRGRALRDRWIEQAKALAAPAGQD
ncbi:hypothetical protein ASG43_08450 [Aureimonas sp. Leaf454]|uniref:NADH-quinone oxidoreductase subunit NuoE n=1 Tax=Aureimonas sp. Leaf454 TaxID=1736381 RepID=UPI000700E825|nr:NADH-quinone oxidoreductase subunit NuoE [Aureimonas sp. Leaf454]KQT48864.1 hypothetical protein ASG43_08450 [Aureimonas sp. Leaf454]